MSVIVTVNQSKMKQINGLQISMFADFVNVNKQTQFLNCIIESLLENCTQHVYV